MPLVDIFGDDEKMTSVMCACGERFRNHGQWYCHVPHCKMDRCQRCLTVIGKPPFDDEYTHVCPITELMNLKRKDSNDP